MVTLMFAAVSPLPAQTIMDDSTTQNRGYLRVGVEPTTMITFGYQRNLDMRFLDRNVTTFAEWGASMFRFGVGNSELKIGGILVVFGRGSFKVVNNFNLSVGSVTTQNFDSWKFAVADEVAGGLYRERWFVATTVEYEKIYLNHIKHTDFYRTTYYEDAEDGWYKGAGGMFQFGVEGGGTIKERYDIHLEIKLPLTGRFNSYGGSPAHLNLGFGYRF